MKQRLLVCEYLSGGGLGPEPAGADLGLLGQGLAMRDAMIADLARLPDLELCVAAGAGLPAPRGVARLASPRAGESMVEFLRREAPAHDRVWVVAPESDGLLAALATVVGEVRWIGCRLDAVRLCSGKRATLERLAAHGIATPLGCGRGARRWVVKPDDGAGALDTRVHAERAAAEADLAARLDRGAAATLEPWVEGRALSLSLLCRAGETELLAINRQRIEVEPDGRVRYAGVTRLADGGVLTQAGALSSTARAIGRAIPGLRGFVGVDIVWHAASGPIVIEVNPRLTCAYVGLSDTLGRNLAAEVLAALAEEAHVAA